MLLQTELSNAYDALMQEYRELKAGSEALREEHAAQAMAIDNILQELSQLSGRTVLLRSEIESGTVQLTQVEQIEENISSIFSVHFHPYKEAVYQQGAPVGDGGGQRN